VAEGLSTAVGCGAEGVAGETGEAMPVPDGTLANTATGGGGVAASKAVTMATDGVENGAGNKPMCFFFTFFFTCPGLVPVPTWGRFFLFFFHMRFFSLPKW
jgi:hypothetical protein